MPSTTMGAGGRTMAETRTLGTAGGEVAAVGYGAMVLEGFYGDADEGAALATLGRALELGMMIDTADAYGNGHNERLVGRALRGRRRDAVIATKFGIVFEDGVAGTALPTGWGITLPINATPAYAKRALDASLARLGVDVIDLWYVHFPDPATPIEETVGAMADAVHTGKVRWLGLSNVTADQVRRAHAVHPIAAVQYEYSLWQRDAERELLPTLQELGIALVPWAPLGSGFLTGRVALSAGDFRHNNPRFAGDALERNRDRFAPLLDVARELAITPAQLALAWLLHQGPHVIPIPGTRSADRITENAAAADVVLPPETITRLSALAPPHLAEGATLLSPAP